MCEENIVPDALIKSVMARSLAINGLPNESQYFLEQTLDTPTPTSTSTSTKAAHLKGYNRYVGADLQTVDVKEQRLIGYIQFLIGDQMKKGKAPNQIAKMIHEHLEGVELNDRLKAYMTVGSFYIK